MAHLPDCCPQYRGAVRAIAAGKYHSLALLTDGRVLQWGAPTAGTPPPEVQLPCNSTRRGSNTANTSTATATTSAILDTDPSTPACIVSVHAGDDSSLAVRSDGTVHAWGETVTGSAAEPLLYPMPTLLTGMTGLKDIVRTRKNGWMALFKNGTLLNYTSAEGAPPPDAPIVVQDVKQMSVSTRALPIHALVLFNNGSITAWGRQDDGLCSGPTTELETSPVVQVAAGTDSLVLLANDSVVGFGANNFAQLETKKLSRVAKIGHGESYVVALLSDGSLSVWGKLREVGLPVLPVPHAPS